MTRRRTRTPGPAARREPFALGAGEMGGMAKKVEKMPETMPAVPYMVDETRSPIDFTVLDPSHVEACATRGRCGVCGLRIKRGPVAFIGPDDGRRCFADPWMHPACAEASMRRCPFLGGRRDWREAEVRGEPLLAPYSQGMVPVLARNWRAHRDPSGAWHFEAVGSITRLDAPTASKMAEVC